MSSKVSGNRISSSNFRSHNTGEGSTLDRYYSIAKQTIEENPLLSILSVFGIGLALGSLAGGLLAEISRGQQPTLSNRIQRRVGAVLSEMLPHSLEQKLRG